MGAALRCKKPINSFFFLLLRVLKSVFLPECSSPDHLKGKWHLQGSIFSGIVRFSFINRKKGNFVVAPLVPARPRVGGAPHVAEQAPPGHERLPGKTRTDSVHKVCGGI